MKTIKGILKYKDWGDCNLCVEYKDDKYEVYSYRDGDGIWGWNIREDEEFKEAIELFGQEALNKAFDDYEDVPVEIPFSIVEKQGYCILNRKTQKPITMLSEDDLWSMMDSGVVTLPDGSSVEPDAENSPLRELGFI